MLEVVILTLSAIQTRSQTLESDEEESLSQFLVNWNSRHSITREAMKELLGGLRVHNHPGLPLDPRTLLRTNLDYNVEDKCGGSYVYLSLAKSLKSTLSRMHSFQVSNNIELHLQYNIDGVPVFNSGKQCMWPILCRVVKPFISPVFILLHCMVVDINRMISASFCDRLLRK